MTKLLIAGLMAAVAVPALAQYTPAQVDPRTAPMMNDRVMTRAAVQGQVARMFARLDTNRDGIILKAEADAARQGMRGDRRGMRGERRGMRGQGMHGMHRDPAAAFARIDANRDNMISRDEFTAMHAQRADKRAANGQGMRGKRGGMGRGMGFGGMMFDRADANRDGRVTLAEAQSQAFVHFDMMDANRDGQVTREERRNMRQNMGANRNG